MMGPFNFWIINQQMQFLLLKTPQEGLTHTQGTILSWVVFACSRWGVFMQSVGPLLTLPVRCRLHAHASSWPAHCTT